MPLLKRLAYRLPARRLALAYAVITALLLAPLTTAGRTMRPLESPVPATMPAAIAAADAPSVTAESEEHEDADEPLGLDQLAGLDVKLMPIDFARVTSHFGHRTDPFKRTRKFHSGIDFGAPQGTAIHAVAGGKVILAGHQAAYGNVVVIEHRPGYRTLYAHASKLLVKAGQIVDAGAVIAKVGSTGRSTGAHLHFEVHHSGQRVDPRLYLVGL
ncbi:M23 family metallopeptidase [Dyella sp. BiH032]|uniref:M23 family metallopeptidase n=1 Tax=Dyella sp. BiH032 TaxID=3075430 RepID=UPI002892F726|nr:M23 family metallopeptidase [Dyella sp. BiH032]WNL46634.1 M23 family metallopeptidase [Dyella sp. BiH032]